MNRTAALLASAALLAACATTNGTAPATSTDLSESGTVVTSGPFQATLWLSDRFKGTQSRELDGNVLDVEMLQVADGGGLDTSVGRAEKADPTDRPRFDAVHPDAASCFAFDVDLAMGENSSWWAGPKISVNWQDAGLPDGMSGWYENYVVETGSRSPAELEAGLMDWGKGVFIGGTVHDGATYRHIRAVHRDWTQFWAIRQDFRDSGTTSLGPIFAKWREGGLPGELPVDGVKVNIETYGPVEGTFRVVGDAPADLTSTPELVCKPTPL